MDDVLRKQLKKLEHEYNFEKTVHIGRYYRNNTDGGRTYSSDTPKKTRFTLDSMPCEEKLEMEKDGFLKRCVRNLGDSLRYRAESLRIILADWIYLALLGFLVAFLSASIDSVIYFFQEVQEWTTTCLPETHSFFLVGTFSAFLAFLTLMLIASATLVHFISPQAIGSGIPEMKTIIRGVVLKDYLTFRTLISKILGLSFSLGSGVPIGKMGPFVHIASVVAHQLSLFAARFDPAFGSETRRMETLSAACAVGVACTFSAPVGGVLFSIEVTTMYFSVRNYWRGFFAACCGATTIRLLRGIFVESEVTTNAFFQTNFEKDAFVADELPLFALLGLFCGLFGALYIMFYKRLVLFLRKNTIAKTVFQQHWIVYPIFVAAILSFVTFPHGAGNYITGRMRFSRNLRDFFSNCTFTEPAGSRMVCGDELFEHWVNHSAEHNVLTSLVLFLVTLFISSIVSTTLPVPTGIFMPIFVLGAGLGRLQGEIIAMLLPNGFVNGLFVHPGIYAVVGAASFSGAVTHSVSVSVIVFEATGQLHFLLPVMIATIISNAVCTYLHPSYFDTIIDIKHLPFLPDIPPSSNIVHTICAENIMVSPVMFITRVTQYEQIRNLLVNGSGLRIFPVVESMESQMLIGTVSRRCLLGLLEEKVGDKARKAEAERRVRKAIETIDMHFTNSQKEIGVRSARNMRRPSLFEHHTIQSVRRTKSEKLRSRFRGVDQLDIEGIFDENKSGQGQENGENGMNKVQEEKVDAKEQLEKKRPSKKINRFLVTPTSEEKVIEPPEARTPSQNTYASRRNAFCSLQGDQKSRDGLEDGERPQSGSDGARNHVTLHLQHVDYQQLVKSYVKQAKKYIHALKGVSRKPSHHFEMYDLTGTEREEWECSELKDSFVFTDDLIDPSPFQLVKKTSLYKIHSIFSMLQLSKAYVTDCGRLIGVVALSDVRRALERSQGELAAEAEPLAGKDDLEAGPSHIVEHKPPERKISDQVHDVLTPTLEVVRPVSTSRNGVLFQLDSPELTVTRRGSCLRHQPHRPSPGIFTEKPTEEGVEAEDLVEAVAYLRRKSIRPIERSHSTGPPPGRRYQPRRSDARQSLRVQRLREEAKEEKKDDLTKEHVKEESEDQV